MASSRSVTPRQSAFDANAQQPLGLLLTAIHYRTSEKFVRVLNFYRRGKVKRFV